MFKVLTIAIPLAGLIVTVFTFYYIRIDHGTVEMTQPSFIYLQTGDNRFQASTVVFAALIHGTSDRGLYVESLDVRLQREDGLQNFAECMYEDHGEPHPGAFLADRQGLATNFHFWSPGYGTWYSFLPGEYTLRVFARIAGTSEQIIGEEHFSITPDLFRAMRKQNKGIYFVWSPGGQCYVGHVGSIGPKLNLNKINGRIL